MKYTFALLTLVLCFLALPALSSAKEIEIEGCVNLTKDMQAGSTDAKVKGEVSKLHKFLVENNLLSSTSKSRGVFDSEMEAAVMEFQEYIIDETGSAYGVEVNGAIDKNTRKAIAGYCQALKAVHDITVKASLSSLRSAAELHYDATGSYTPATSCKTGMFAASGVSSTISQIPSATCRSNGSAFVAYAPVTTKGMWCVDSSGATKVIKKAPKKGSYSCDGKVAKKAKIKKTSSSATSVSSESVPPDSSLLYTNKSQGYTIKFPAGWKRSMPSSLKKEWDAYASFKGPGQAEIAVRTDKIGKNTCYPIDMCNAYFLMNMGFAGYSSQEYVDSSKVSLIWIDGYEGRVAYMDFKEPGHEGFRSVITLFIYRGDMLYTVVGNTDYTAFDQGNTIIDSIYTLDFI